MDLADQTRARVRLLRGDASEARRLCFRGASYHRPMPRDHIRGRPQPRGGRGMRYSAPSSRSRLPLKQAILLLAVLVQAAVVLYVVVLLLSFEGP